MYWTSPSHVPQLPFLPPDTIPIHEFLFSDENNYGRHSKLTSKPPFTCGTTGKAYSVSEVTERIECLATALSKDLGWSVNDGNEMDKVIGIFSYNSIDSLTVSWAAHRLSGVSCPVSVFYSTTQLADQLSFVRCKALFTCTPLLDSALEAAAAAGIPRQHVYVLDVPEHLLNGKTKPLDIKSVDQLIQEGSILPNLPSLKWEKGQGARQTAFLITSSGTSGLPKNVKVSHRNVIAHTMQFATFEGMYRTSEPQMGLGLLPQSHAYALLLISHASAYNGDGVIVMQGFDLNDTLRAIQNFRIARLYVVPSMIVAMTKAADVLKQYDLKSVNSVVFGASPLSMETISFFSDLLSGCSFLQGYGLTETCCIVTFTSPDDAVFGSCGNLLPGVEARLIDKNGQEISQHNCPGELFIRSPSVVLGYYGNEEASKNMLTDDGWLRTGDLVEFRQSPEGHSHLFVIDRLKELIKVRGMQVAPAELETFLLQHPMVADASVIPIPDEAAGELPRAYIVKSQNFKNEDDEIFKQKMHSYVNGSFPQYKHLSGGIELVDSLPKTPSGKTQRMVLKLRARASVEANKRAIETQQKAAPSAVRIIEFDSDEEDDDA